MLTFDYSQ